jgi:hypothetical protein
MPHGEDLQRVLQEIERLIEEDVAEPPAGYDSQHRPGNEIVDVLPVWTTIIQAA